MQPGPPPPWGNSPPSWGPPPPPQAYPYPPAPFGPGGHVPTGPLPWSPNAIAVICFCFTFLAGGIMHAINWERLGRPKAKLPRLIVTLLAFPLYMAAAILTPADAPYTQIFMFANIGIAAFFRHDQQAAFDAHVARGGGRASLKMPIALAATSLVAMLGLGGAYAWVDLTADEARFEEGRAMMAAGDHAGAEARFREYRSEHPEDLAAYHNLVLIHVGSDRVADARRELVSLRKQDPKYAELPALEEAVDEREYQLALADLEAERYAAAEPVFRRFKQKRAGDPDMAYNLALLYQRSKRLPLAEKELEQLLARHPDHESARALLVEVATAQGAPPPAEPTAPTTR